MKIYTTHTTGILDRWMRFLGAMLVTALMIPAIAVSQSSIVNLGASGDFVILAKTGISTTGVTHITGDIGVSPALASAITGFNLIAAGTYSTSSLITGNVFAPDYTEPTPTNLTTAIGNMQTAYTDAANRTLPDSTELGAGNITGKTLTHGLFKWGTGVQIDAAGVTISGSATDIWIFQIAGDLTVANDAHVTLIGALASNIFWQVAGQVTIGTTAVMNGNILCLTKIAMNSSATLNGRALAQTAVTLIGNTVNKPATVTAVENIGIAPREFALFQNYPNPFNPSTKIQYYLAKPAQVLLKVYNVLGLEVATLVNGHQEANSYIVQFNSNEGGLNLSSGVYFYRLEAGSFVSTKKLILMK
jgi:hypothetical protein